MAVRRLVLSVVAVSAIGLSALPMNASAEEAPAPVRAAADDRSAVVPDQPDPIARGIIVQTTTATPSDAALDATDDALGSEANVADDSKVTGRISAIDFDQPVDADVASDVAQEVAKRSDVVWAAPNSLMRHNATSPVSTDDPLFKSQRNLWNLYLTTPAGGYSIKAPALWQTTKGSGDVRVAVLDTGVLKNHPDLEGQLVDGWDFVGADDPDAALPKYSNANDGNGWDSDPSDPGDWAYRGLCYRGQPAYDSSWHGTFVAGQVAAKTDNAIGIAGVAPGIKVQPVRVLGRCGGWDSDIMAAITWASGGHVEGVPDNPTPSQVINMSLGETFSKHEYRNKACLAYNSVLAQARARGTLVVASAGNEFWSADLAVPASCTNVTSVAATSAKGFKSVYSNKGQTVDLSAPGGDTKVGGPFDSIISLGNEGIKRPAANTYVRYEGTSMAAPQVSAGAALIYGYLAERGPVTVAQLESALSATVSKFPNSAAYRAKRVTYDGVTYQFNLNCTTYWCGRGILDLSKVPVPLTPPTIVGDLVVGEPLRVEQGEWQGVVPPTTVTWRVDGVERPVYVSGFRIARDDIGKTITAEVRPTNEGYSRLSMTSATSAPVPLAPEVTITSFQRSAASGLMEAQFTVQNGSAPAADGIVEVRRDDTSEVLATGQVEGGVGVIAIPEDKWRGGNNAVRVAYLGAGADRPASSKPAGFRHDPVAPQVKATLATRVSHLSRATVKIAVIEPNGTSASGGLWIYDNWKVIAKLSTPASGLRSYTLPRLSKGTHKIKVSYRGNLYLLPGSTVKTITSY